MIRVDFLQTYGIDLSVDLLRERTASWLQDLILGLRSCDSRISRYIASRNQ